MTFLGNVNIYQSKNLDFDEFYIPISRVMQLELFKKVLLKFDELVEERAYRILIAQ
jgi:hypothetical protein